MTISESNRLRILEAAVKALREELEAIKAQLSEPVQTGLISPEVLKRGPGRPPKNHG